MSLFMYWMLKYHGMHLMELQFSGILEQSKFGYQPECRLEVKAVQTFISHGRTLLLCRKLCDSTEDSLGLAIKPQYLLVTDRNVYIALTIQNLKKC